MGPTFGEEMEQVVYQTQVGCRDPLLLSQVKTILITWQFVVLHISIKADQWAFCSTTLFPRNKGFGPRVKVSFGNTPELSITRGVRSFLVSPCG